MKQIPSCIVLVGLMGCGKSRIGVELARLMDLPFIDADREIEDAAGMPVTEIFTAYGEDAFRALERKVMARLLDAGAAVIASGGGAFIQDEIRAAVLEKAVSVWLRAGLDTLVERTAQSTRRPLLLDVDPVEKLRTLMDVRYPVYAQADITVDSDKNAPMETAEQVLEQINSHARAHTR